MTHGLRVADSGGKLWLFLEVYGFMVTACKNLNYAFVHLDFEVLFFLFRPLVNAHLFIFFFFHFFAILSRCETREKVAKSALTYMGSSSSAQGSTLDTVGVTSFHGALRAQLRAPLTDQGLLLNHY